MNKKILIASIFATLMLLVPMTSVVGVSDVEDCGCQVVNSSDLVRVKLLMVRLKVVTNILLLRYGHIPEIQEKCQEILEIINPDNPLDVPLICDILLYPIWRLMVKFAELAFSTPNELMSLVYYMIAAYLEVIFVRIGYAFNCEDWEPPEP